MVLIQLLLPTTSAARASGLASLADAPDHGVPSITGDYPRCQST
jgi:hypothetical protein